MPLVLLCRNGDLVRLAPGPAEVVDQLPSGRLYKDGSLIVEADNKGAAAAGRISLHLTAGEKESIIAFLHTLTDRDFVTAERFSDPFARK